jgi:hypothetical protein
MHRWTWIVAVGLASAALASGVSAQGVKEVVGATPWETVDNEPPPKLFVDPPLAEPLSRGAIVLQYRVENFHILPVVGAAAVSVSPRIGHLHIGVDDLPWHWAEASDNNTIIVVGLPPGPHKISVDLADPQHRVITGKVVAVTIPGAAPVHQH